MRLVYFSFSFLLSLSLPAQVLATKKMKITPYQSILQQCLDKKVDVLKINTNKELYKVIENFYPLVSSDILYREVFYTQKDVLKKLKLEAGKIQIYTLDEDDNPTLLSSEKVGDVNQGNELRHKALSTEARMNQLLFRANISSDYSKVREIRSKQVSLNMEWSDTQIKSMDIALGTLKKSLNCQQVESQDICTCADKSK
jgi:hypothetical protein